MTTRPKKIPGWPPKAPAAPSLAHLDSKNVLNLILNRWFGDAGLKGPVAWPLQTNLVRLIDKSILAYERGRGALERYATTPNNVMGPLFRAVDAFEDLVVSLHRALLYADALRSQRPDLGIDGQLPDASERDRIRLLRNAIEHTDEHIVEGRRNLTDEGVATTLLLTNTDIQLEGHLVSYQELSIWLVRLQELAAALNRLPDR